MAVLAALQEWRTSTAESLTAERGSRMPAYIVATDATLLAIAEQRPGTLQALAEIPGIGPRKIDDYGTQILAVIEGAAS